LSSPQLNPFECLPAAPLNDLLEILVSMFQENSLENSSKGATNEELQKIQIVVPTKELLAENCVICLENFRLRSKIMKLDCNHHFCKGCISKWFENSTDCPTCRHSIREKKKILQQIEKEFIA